MTYREFMAARLLLFEEHFGVHIRAAERAERVREAAYHDQYRASVERLKRQQE